MVEERSQEEKLEAWLAEERERLDKGFSFEPQPMPKEEPPDRAQDILAGMGLGAGVLAGVIADHLNPVTFEGCSASTLAQALKSHLTDRDTGVAIEDIGEATVVTILQRQPNRSRILLPALTVTLIETDETLTVAMSDLSRDIKRGAIGSIGRAALQGSRSLLLRRRGLAGTLDAAGGLVQSIEEAGENLNGLSLPRQAWTVIDRVGGAAEAAYLEEQRVKNTRDRERRRAERAWTHCEWCGRAYAPDDDEVVQCPSCGAPRGPKPEWLA